MNVEDIRELLLEIDSCLENYDEFYYDYNSRSAKMGMCDWHPLEEIWNTLREILNIMETHVDQKWFDSAVETVSGETFDRDDEMNALIEDIKRRIA